MVGSLVVYVLPTRVEDMAQHVAEPPVPRALSSLWQLLVRVFPIRQQYVTSEYNNYSLGGVVQLCVLKQFGMKVFGQSSTYR